MLKRSANKTPVIGGFTLLEVLAALMVMVLVTTGLASISGTNARATRALANRTAQLWQHEQVVSVYIQSLKGGSPANLPSEYTVISSPEPVNEVQAEKLAQTQLVLLRVQVRTVNPPELIYDGNVLAKAN